MPLQPLRLQSAPAGDERGAWELLRSVDTDIAPSELSAARILSRINAETQRAAGGYPRWFVAASAAALSLIGLQVAVAAVLAGAPALRHALGSALLRRLGPAAVVAPMPPKPVAGPSPTASAPALSAPLLLSPAPLVVPASGVHRSVRPHAGPMPSAPVATPAPLSSAPEVEVMAKAARELYADHDPLAALATLEPYLYFHPGGSLRSEMIVAAVQANLDLDRTPEALGLLDGMVAQDFRGIPRAPELRLLRGELLAQSHRCREALPLFEQSLAAMDSLHERALYGRAVCRAELQDFAGSRADLRAYLSQYPEGRFATEAGRALERSE